MLIINNKTKTEIEKVVKNAMYDAMIELDRSKKYFTEEALRYIVMSHIGKLKTFGQFPNIGNGKTRLVFEFPYKRAKTREHTYRPDIASIQFNSISQRNPEISEHLLAIELKIKNNVDDIKKCRHYISEKAGRMTFKLAICIVLPPKLSNGVISKIHAKEITTRGNSRILFCTVQKDDTGNKAPITMWLV